MPRLALLWLLQDIQTLLRDLLREPFDIVDLSMVASVESFYQRLSRYKRTILRFHINRLEYLQPQTIPQLLGVDIGSAWSVHR